MIHRFEPHSTVSHKHRTWHQPEQEGTLLELNPKLFVGLYKFRGQVVSFGLHPPAFPLRGSASRLRHGEKDWESETEF